MILKGIKLILLFTSFCACVVAFIMMAPKIFVVPNKAAADLLILGCGIMFVLALVCLAMMAVILDGGKK
jgi:NADH:ubiquinone oxidoreductase subunit H